MSDKIVELPAVGLWADMGLGKTVAVLTAIEKLLRTGKIKKVIIIAPLLVAESTWPDEVHQWAHLKHLKYSVITGTEAERIAAAQSDAPIHIINRENIVWYWNHLKKKSPYDMLVYDEASRLKSGKMRTPPTGKLDREGELKKTNLSEFGAVCRFRATVKKVVELSGTPAPNGLIDLWGPLYVLDLGRRLGMKKHYFHSRWFDWNKYTYKRTAFPHSFDQIMSAVSDICFSLKSEDYLTLPDRIDNVVRIKLPKKAMEQYRRFEREFLLEEYDIEAVNKGVLTNKLLQLSNGSVYNGDKEPIEIHRAKLDALESIIEQAGGRPVLVAYGYQFDLMRIKERFPHAVVLNEEQDVVRKWNAGKIQLLVTHPASAAHGLNLQYGGNLAVWYGVNWSLELYNQFNKRLHRSGQKYAVMIHHLICEGTFDELQLAALGVKDATQESVLDYTKALIPEIYYEHETDPRRLFGSIESVERGHPDNYGGDEGGECGFWVPRKWACTHFI